MATITQTKLVGFCLGNKTNYNATAYANHIWFDPTNKQILLNGIEYIPKKLSELVNDSGFLTSITKSMVEGVLTGNITSHTHTFASITSKPTTLGGYGITDAMRFTNSTDYVAARFNDTSLAIKAANNYIELWQSGAGWFNLRAGKFIIDGGTSAQFLKGDGSLDSNTYALSSALGNYLPLTGGTLSGALTCNGDYINMNNDSGSRGYRGFFNQSGSANRASGSHIFMYGGGQALGSNSVSIGYQAYAGIRNEDADKTTYPYIAWQWMPTEKFSVNTTNSATLSGGEYYGFPLLPNEMVQWNIGGQNVIYENSSSYEELLVVIKASDADTGLVFGGKTTLPYRASKTLIAGKYIVGRGEYLKKINEYTINGVKYYQVIIYTWNTTAFPTSYDFTQQVKVMCATKVNNSNYSGASSYASGNFSVASGYSSVASGYSSVASGNFSVASGNFSVASGYSSVASGYSSVASGYYSVASGYYSVASGYSSVASGNASVASGDYSVASGNYSVASGNYSVASGNFSVASGYSSVASGNYSVASGYYSVASGYYSVASGYYSVASGDFSVVLAQNGETMSSYQTIIGRYNAKVAGLFIIGNGSSSARSNALVVDESGNVTAKYFSGYANAVGSEGIKVYANNSNEINFGGISSSAEILFGYRSMDSRPTPTIYNFGNGTATLKAASFTGNAATASKISDLTNADDASNTDTWRKVWISYNNGVTGRPALSSNLAYQASTNTLKVGNLTNVGDITFSAANKNIGTSSVPLSELWTKGVSSPTTLIIGAGTSVMTFDKDGNVAIGKSSVSKYKLDVSGSIYSMSGGITSADGFIKLGSSDSYVLLAGGGTKAVSDFATSAVATASADGLMSAAMFKAQMVKSVSVRQGGTAVIGGGTITNHSVYITQNKNNLTNSYVNADGDGDVKIPNATTTYDGSMSYTDKKKLDKMPNTVFGAEIAFYGSEILIDGVFGDYNIETDATVDGYETVQENNHYITMVAFNITNTDLVDKLHNGFVKFGYSSKDNSNYQTMRLLQSNFDGAATLFVEFIHANPIVNTNFWFDCIWEVYPF